MYSFLLATDLFCGVGQEALGGLLKCLCAEQKRFEKGRVIYRAGDRVTCLGLVLSGRVYIESNDPWGNNSMLSSVGPGCVFAETYACLPDIPMMVNAVVSEPTEILFLNAGKLLTPCRERCTCHDRVIRNLLMISAEKNLNLSRRIFHTSAKTIRGRLCSYLTFEAARQGGNDFTIPFDRQQLADYLGVDRSALSHELGKMQREGLLTVHKNHFWLQQGIHHG